LKERGKELEERFHLSLTLLNHLLRKSLLERGLCPLSFSSPPSLARGRGSGGWVAKQSQGEGKFLAISGYLWLDLHILSGDSSNIWYN